MENFQESPMKTKNPKTYREIIKIDGKKFIEILNDNESTSPGYSFFSKIMGETNTSIIWPTRNADTKNKREISVEISGDKDGVIVAKEQILKMLSIKNDRITMKMDISYTDHSHLIGKRGLSIKRVMEETQCHIHFPDSNRYNPTKKSNQVSISGDVGCVELARTRLRKMIPLIFGFEPSIFGEIIDNKDRFVQELEANYHVQVMFKTRSKLNATIVLVKGDEWELERVKEATIKLMEYICKDSTLLEDIPIQMTIQIPPQYHSIVLGPNHINLKSIIKYTNTKILVPDAQDENIGDLKKNNISISGNNIHNVYIARQLLMGNLPLHILFELPSDLFTNNNDQNLLLNHIQMICNVSISIFQRNKQNAKTCLIKGIEREAANIYKARNFILGNETIPNVQKSDSLHHNSQQESPENSQRKLPTACNYTKPSNNNNYDDCPNLNPSTPSTSTKIPQEISKHQHHQWTDLTCLLNSFGLNEYIRVFLDEEIDLEIFSTLNDNDLRAIGIETVDVRRIMLATIAELNKQIKSFPLAPGAERKKTFQFVSC